MNVTCPSCEDGKTVVHIMKMEKDGKWVLDDGTIITCVTCDGEGVVDIELVKTMDNLWCKCNTDHGVKFYDDGQHKDLHKHHYRCKQCLKVVQIG